MWNEQRQHPKLTSATGLLPTADRVLGWGVGAGPADTNPHGCSSLYVKEVRTPHTVAVHACGLPRLSLASHVFTGKYVHGSGPVQFKPMLSGPSEHELDKEGKGRQGGKRCLVSK